MESQAYNNMLVSFAMLPSGCHVVATKAAAVGVTVENPSAGASLSSPALACSPTQ